VTILALNVNIWRFLEQKNDCLVLARGILSTAAKRQSLFTF
jgi:hypothetical protein